jgi:hypothetical protein
MAGAYDKEQQRIIAESNVSLLEKQKRLELRLLIVNGLQKDFIGS